MNSQVIPPYPNGLDPAPVREFVDSAWSIQDGTIVPTLIEYIGIPNKSPSFDPAWQEHGHMDRVVELFTAWARAQEIEGMALEVMRAEGRTPLIFMEIPAAGECDDTVLLYGHLDKQPEMIGWAEGKGPWIPVMEGERLYGRGGADDGYSMFAALNAIGAVRAQGATHARCIVVIEACEESGSNDLPFYIEDLMPRIGTPSLIICLDSGCGNYDQLWCTTSLRGVVTANLTVELLHEGVHSGDGSGIIASSFRVLRELLSRLEDESTGRVIPEALHVDIPEQRVEQARAVARVLDTAIFDKFPLVDGVVPVTDDLTELALARTWRPALSITGVAGLPALGDAGNVLRPSTSVKLSLRLPPTLDSDTAVTFLRELLTINAPYGAHITVDDVEGASGWDAPPLADWLRDALQDASNNYFGADAMYMGEGGSIPFMGMLGEKFPEAQFMITGVLGPHSNAHGPNEFLDLPCARKVTACVADVLAAHAKRSA